MHIEELRHKVTVAFTRADKKECPYCKNVVEIDLRNQAQANQFLGMIEHYNDSQAEKINKSRYFMNARVWFWMFFTLAIWFTGMSYFIKDYFNIYALMAMCFGIIYILVAIAYFIIKKIKAKKQLENEIESLIKVKEPTDG